MKSETDRHASSNPLTGLQANLQDILSGLDPLELSEVLVFATTLKEREKPGNGYNFIGNGKLTPCEKAAEEFKRIYETLAEKFNVPYALLTQNEGLTYEQVAAIFGVDVKTVCCWADCKMLPVIKVSNWRAAQIYAKAKKDIYRVRPDDLIVFERQNPSLRPKGRRC